MTISDRFILKISNADYWWGNNYFYSELYKQYKIRAAFGLMDIRILKEIKRN